MDSGQRRRIEELFFRAIELEPQERNEFLEEVCGPDGELRVQVERLLQHDQERTDVVGLAIGEMTKQLLEAEEREHPAQVGPYRVIRRIGSGGMGEVYLAEQDEPIQRVLALKLVKPGMDTQDVLARFESERQALALMNHTCIAKVHDAGTTVDGRPYFVMEHVVGEPITDYCDKERLTARDRIGVFLQVCDGVQHAHQKGIIHRDLKPSNILVTVENGRPLPKIIDFGIAKATSSSFVSKAARTQLGVGIGTPEYMSPEQLRAGEDVDTRTDVYALGVLLYELLTGTLPFGSELLRSLDRDELRRKICEEEPPPPSRHFGTRGGAGEEALRARRTDRESYRRLLSCEPDWITMKAMEKDRTRRYGSPEDLAADIRRYLAHEPVLAGPPSPLYRTRKFVRRHRAGAIAVVAVTLALLSGTVTTSIGMVRALQAERVAITEARTAKEVTDFLVGLFRESGPAQARGEDVTVRAILERGTRQVQATLTGQPAVQARMLHTIGLVYLELGLHDDAESALNEALTIRRTELGGDHPDTLTSVSDLGELFQKVGRIEEAESLQQEAWERRHEVLGEEHPDTLQSKERLAYLDRDAGRHEEAQTRLEEVVETRRRVQGEDHPDTLYALSQLAWLYWIGGRPAEAAPLARQALEGSIRVLGEDHPRTLTAMDVLATMSEREVENERLLERALSGRRRILGDEHPKTLNNAYLLAITYEETGRHQTELELLIPTVEASRRVWGEEKVWTALYENGLGLTYNALGLHEQAEAVLDDLVERARRVNGPDDRYTLFWARNLGVVYASQGRFREAEVLHEDTLERSRESQGESAPWTAYMTAELGLVRDLQGHGAKAEVLYREAISLREDEGDASAEEVLRLKLRLASFCVRQLRVAEAEAIYEKVIEHGRQMEGMRGRRLLSSSVGQAWDPLWGLAMVRRAQGAHLEAEDLLLESLELQKENYGESSPRYRFHQARYEVLHGNREGALNHIRGALDGGFGVSDLVLDRDLAPLRTDPKFQGLIQTARERYAAASTPG